jgi:hypothetical protein
VPQVAKRGVKIVFNRTELIKKIQELPDRPLLLLARGLAKLWPLEPYPGWYFGIAEESTELGVQLRRAIWNT